MSISLENLRAQFDLENWIELSERLSLVAEDEIKCSWQFSFFKAALWSHQGYPELAIPYFEISLHLNNSNLEASWWLAQAFMDLQQWKFAEKHLSALFHSHLPDQGLVYIAYFRAHAWLGHAVQAEQQLLRLSLGSAHEMSAMGVALCEINLLLGKPDLAEQCLERLIQLDPEFDGIVNLRLMILAAGWHEGGIQKQLEEMRCSSGLSRLSWLHLIRTSFRFRLWDYTESLLDQAIEKFGLSGQLADEMLLFLVHSSRYPEIEKALIPLPAGISVEPSLLKAQCLCNLDRFDEAKCCLEGLESLPFAQFLLSDINHRLGDHHSALEIKRSLFLASPTPANEYDLCLCLLALQQWQEAWPLYESRFQVDAAHFVTPAGIKPRNSSIPPHDRNVIIFGEQGVGDTIMMASMLPDLLRVASKVTLFVQPRLVDLFAQSFSSLTVVSTIDAAEFGLADSCYGLGSLGQFFRPSPSSCSPRAYLLPSKYCKSPVLQQINDLEAPLKIGICWRGGSGDANGMRRSIPLDRWAPIFSARPDASWVSLQYRPDPTELEYVASQYGVAIHHFDDVANDLNLTASVVSKLDLVISVQQSILHLCGALGVQAWVLLPCHPEWRYGLEGDQMPWYSSVCLYRQREPGDWSDPFSRLLADLRNFPGRS